MIVYVTTVKGTYNSIYSYAQQLIMEAGTKSRYLAEVPMRLNSYEMMDWADVQISLAREAPKKLHVIVGMEEAIILRVLRRIRETHENQHMMINQNFDRSLNVSIEATDFMVHCLTSNGEVQKMRVDETGEFVDRWRDGFFDWRSTELF